jgi:hypothetical protein
MKKIVSFDADIGENEEGKIVWEYEITERWIDNGRKVSQKSEIAFDTEEEAASDLIKNLNYVLTGEM